VTQNGSFTGDFTNQTKGEQLTATFISRVPTSSSRWQATSASVLLQL